MSTASPTIEAPADPKAADFLQDPFGFYDWLRANNPVYLDPRHGIYFVGTYELAEQVFKDHDLFSSNVYRPAMRQGGIFQALQEIKDRDWPVVRTMSQNDDAPTHDTFRALVSHFFLPRSLAALEPFVRGKVDELLTSIEGRGACDAIQDLAVPLPIAVIGEMLGFEGEARGKLKAWSDAFADELGLLTSDARALEAAELILEAHRCMVETAERRMAEPRADIISHLAHARLPDGRRLTEPELVSMLSQLLIAGNETTTNMLGAGILRLATDRALFERLKREPQLLSSFIEELLRLETPVQGQFRRATRETQLGGVVIPKDALLHVRLASANRDERVFGQDASELQLGARHPRPHLAFGVGMHFCVGAMLSRLEMRLAFGEILARWEDLTLGAPLSELRYRSHFHHRGLLRLPVTVRAKA